MALFIQSGGIKHCLMALLTLKPCKTANIIGFTWVASFILPSGSNTYLIFFFGKKKNASKLLVHVAVGGGHQKDMTTR